jgi:Na+:H+ antiporter, NhaA family
VARNPVRLFARLSGDESRRLADVLRQETVGGLLLGVVTVVALVWANSPWSEAYERLRSYEIGPATLHLHLSLQDWTGDGLLAVFFFVAGLELKREFVVGTLSRPAQAVLPVVAALCGMAMPALIYLAITAGDREAMHGWAVPTATDVAFCLAILALTGSALPGALRAFLLSLAVVDDLVAIIIIGTVYSTALHPLPLVAALVPLAAYGLLQRVVAPPAWLLLVLAALGLTTWALVHASGVHPTVAGVALALLTRVRPREPEHISPVDRYEHALRPWSAAVAVPAFALLAVGITISADTLSAAASDPAATGVVVGRVVGKTIGVFGGAYVVARLTAAQLADELDWSDIFAMAVLTGVGFAVPLLVSTVAFGAGSPRDEHVTAAILVAAVLAATLGAVLLRVRHRHYQRLADLEASR